MRCFRSMRCMVSIHLWDWRHTHWSWRVLRSFPRVSLSHKRIHIWCRRCCCAKIWCVWTCIAGRCQWYCPVEIPWAIFAPYIGNTPDSACYKLTIFGDVACNVDSLQSRRQKNKCEWWARSVSSSGSICPIECPWLLHRENIQSITSSWNCSLSTWVARALNGIATTNRLGVNFKYPVPVLSLT